MNSGSRFSRSTFRLRSPRELVFRGRQAAYVILERMGLDEGELRPDQIYQSLSVDARRRFSTLDGWVSAFRSRGGDGFFAGVTDPRATSAVCRAIDPDECSTVIARADSALQGRFTLLGLGELDVGLPIDWHRDPVAGVRGPLWHWSRIPYLDPAAVGDHKRVWELNRQQWLVTLAQAWHLTNDDRYAQGAAGALLSWMDANPPKFGVNWSSSLELAFRAISWFWSLRLLGQSSPMDNALVQRMVGHLLVSARHIERNLSTYFSPNTHLTGEALALLYAGLELGDFADARRWRETGRRILLEQLERHVRADGTYMEQSSWYHRYTFDFYTHFLLLERANGVDRPQVHDAVRRLGELLLWISRPDGSLPLIGDDDGGRLLFLDGRPAVDSRPALAAAAALTGDATFLSIGAPSIELPWLFDSSNVDRARALTPRPPMAHTRLFPDGGTVVLRDGWSPRASVMTIDAGPHGVMNGGHAHADALAFDLCVRGVAVLIDPGTFAYTVDPTARDRFRHTASHNAVTVDGQPSSVAAGPFSWVRTATTQVERFASTPDVDWFRGSHNGFTRMPRNAKYTRTIVFIRDGLWVIRDAVVAEGPVVVAAHFQCGVRIEAQPVSANAIRLLFNGQRCADIWAADPSIRIACEAGEVSPGFGASAPAPHLRLSAAPSREASLHTVIGAPDVAIERVEFAATAANAVVTLICEGHIDVIGFGASGSGAVYSIRAHAEAWWVRLERDSRRVLAWCGLECTELAVGGQVLHQSSIASTVSNV